MLLQIHRLSLHYYIFLSKLFVIIQLKLIFKQQCLGILIVIRKIKGFVLPKFG